MKERKVRLGIDVGGTFTKAVVIDHNTLEIIGKVSVLTTHSAAEGVAQGVIHVFQRSLKDFDVNPKNVVFLAHSTTQATNALLEGDVAPVGIVGMGGGAVGSMLARKQTSIEDIPLGTGKVLRTYHAFLKTGKLTPEEAKEAIEDLLSQGARVVVASDSFSVDDPQNELLVMEAASQMGIPATGGHDISKLYGLTVRTRTAVVNASILPKMIETGGGRKDISREQDIKLPSAHPGGRDGREVVFTLHVPVGDPAIFPALVNHLIIALSCSQTI